MNINDIKLGYPLAEYEGGCKSAINGEYITFKTEQEIFDFLRIKYITPQERSDIKNFKLLT